MDNWKQQQTYLAGCELLGRDGSSMPSKLVYVSGMRVQCLASPPRFQLKKNYTYDLYQKRSILPMYDQIARRPSGTVGQLSRHHISEYRSQNGLYIPLQSCRSRVSSMPGNPFCKVSSMPGKPVCNVSSMPGKPVCKVSSMPT